MLSLIISLLPLIYPTALTLQTDPHPPTLTLQKKGKYILVHENFELR